MVSHRSLSRNGQHCGRTLPQRQSPTGPHRQKAPQCGNRHLFSAATVIRSRQSFRPDRCGLLRPRAEAQFPDSRPCDHPLGPGKIPIARVAQSGRGNVPVARTPNPKPYKTPKPSYSHMSFLCPITHYSSLITHIPKYRNQISTLLGV